MLYYSEQSEQWTYKRGNKFKRKKNMGIKHFTQINRKSKLKWKLEY